MRIINLTSLLTLKSYLSHIFVMYLTSFRQAVSMASDEMGEYLVRMGATNIDTLISIHTQVSATRFYLSLSSVRRRGEESDRAKCCEKNPNLRFGVRDFRSALLVTRSGSPRGRLNGSERAEDCAELIGHSQVNLADRAATGGLLRGRHTWIR